MQGDMLLSNQPCPYSSSKMLIEKTCDVRRADVSSTFEKPTSKRWDRVGMCLNEVGHDFGELDLIFEAGDTALLVWKESGERVDVVVVDLRNVWIGDDDERQVPKSLDAVGEADGEQ